MHQKIAQIVFQILLTISIFSLWAGFALLVVNKFFYQDLPGYTIGRICIWELVALVIAAALARRMIKKWGNISVLDDGEHQKILLNYRFGFYFASYALVAVLIGIWQFWMFSQNY